MIVAFVRHGSTAWNEEGRMQGRRDVPLSDRGRAEVEVWRKAALFGRLVPTATPWYSSPLAARHRNARDSFGHATTMRRGTDRDGLG
jgi:probable phosphoglycerate mutase